MVREAKLAFVFSVLVACAGCASVKVPLGGLASKSVDEPAEHSERVALIDATKNLASNPWEGADIDVGVVSVLFGTVAENGRERAVRDYLNQTRATSPDVVAGVLADADSSLSYARRVVETGRQAINAIRPVPSDISTMERAIGETRQCREMYVAALKELRRDGEVFPDALIVQVRDAFTQTIEDMGTTADLVAARVASRDTDTVRVAQPAFSLTGGE